jgi:hypothetical protein
VTERPDVRAHRLAEEAVRRFQAGKSLGAPSLYNIVREVLIEDFDGPTIEPERKLQHNPEPIRVVKMARCRKCGRSWGMRGTCVCLDPDPEFPMAEPDERLRKAMQVFLQELRDAGDDDDDDEDFPSDEEIAEIERLGREQPLEDDEARRLFTKIADRLERHGVHVDVDDVMRKRQENR